MTAGRARRLLDRLHSERGFTMLLALGVMMVTMLLGAAVFNAVQGDATLTRADLNSKQAYAAAQAGVQAYLFQLNNNASNSAWWENCGNDTVSSKAVPGSTTGETYSYQPVYANGSTSTTCTTNPVQALIDSGTGTLRIAVTGRAGTVSQGGQRTIVASFKTLSPLAFLWYTVHETIDTALVQYLNNGKADSTCLNFYRSNPGPDPVCDIYWGPNDEMNGPMYTQDQYLVEAGNPGPTFGRSKLDDIASQVSTSGANDICAGSNCQSATVKGTPEPDVTPEVPLPSDNANLLTDATAHGLALSGTTTLTVNGTQATGWNCPSASASATCTQETIDLTQDPIIYATDAPGCSTGSYDPVNTSYATNNSGHYYGLCGDIYISGSYSTPLTIAAEDDVILTGNLTNSTDTDGNTSPTGPATLGLVADQYVRVMHPCNNKIQSANVTIDGAILTLKHSFFVDNYNCDTPGTLTIHGAIAQFFRGAVGTASPTGYIKNYNYDDRLGVILPPYLFDLQNTQWEVFRETLCSTGATARASSCSASS